MRVYSFYLLPQHVSVSCNHYLKDISTAIKKQSVSGLNVTLLLSLICHIVLAKDGPPGRMWQ